MTEEFKMTTEAPQWYTMLPHHLLSRAYRSGIELAWSAPEAVSVIDILTERGYTILGVDVWIATDPGPTIPTPFVYDWALDERGARNLSARDFITSFAWDASDVQNFHRVPFFNILAVRPA